MGSTPIERPLVTLRSRITGELFIVPPDAQPGFAEELIKRGVMERIENEPVRQKGKRADDVASSPS